VCVCVSLLVAYVILTRPAQIDSTGRIIGFAEKPKGDALKAWAVDTTILGLSPMQARALFGTRPARD
jgi:hypothetical protein